MDPERMKPKHWYWVRRDNGSLAPYRFHQLSPSETTRQGEFFVGSMLQTFSLSRVVGEAKMPEVNSSQ